jgi:hypothetical protein
MLRPFLLTFISLFYLTQAILSQCTTYPASPDCTGTEPRLGDGDTVGGGSTKWYYGAPAAINTVTVDGGTLVVCGDLTIDKFYMNTGTVFIRPGARLVIGSGIGAGLQFKGDCAIYNYGTCEIQRNLTLENNATAATPNRVVNATANSVFKMSNQYFVINNAYSSFVNNGRAEFWGIINDPLSTPGSVCLGMSSTTTMAVLINKVANTYSAPSGNACVRVSQYSEFYGRLSNSPSLFVCLAPGHTSNSGCIPFGCTPNNWGDAQVFTNCAGCAALAVLPVHFSSFTAAAGTYQSVNLDWAMDGAPDGKFMVIRSNDGKTYQLLDSMTASANGKTSFHFTDSSPLPGNNRYMIQFIHSLTGKKENSKMINLFIESTIGFNLYPVPFEDRLFISCEPGVYPEKILLTDVSGRNIKTSHTFSEVSRTAAVRILDKIQPGLYIIHIQTNRNVIARTIFRR